MNKSKIPATVRNSVWNQNIGVEIGQLICMCCKSKPITKANFECGHIIAEKYGGTLELNNLKPVCKHCNTSMGTKNMDDFMKKYGFNVIEKNYNKLIDNPIKLIQNGQHKKHDNIEEIDDTDEIDEAENFEMNKQNMVSFNLKSSCDQYIINNNLNLNPEYQREFIWNDKKQNLLIDSIMRNFIMPPVILINVYDNKSKYDLECIDGQHRLRVIKHYITGEKLNGNYVKWIRKNDDGNIKITK